MLSRGDSKATTDPEGASQVLHAEPAQRNRAGQPVGERRAAVE